MTEHRLGGGLTYRGSWCLEHQPFGGDSEKSVSARPLAPSSETYQMRTLQQNVASSLEGKSA